jgi:hypothetical protein
MDNFGNILSTIGMVACVGGLLIVGLAFFAFRKLTGPKSGPVATEVDRPTHTPMEDLRGPGEQPRFNDRNVTSRGGFGGAPQGPSISHAQNEHDLRTGSISLDEPRAQNLPGGDADAARRRRFGSQDPAKPPSDDDQEVRSRGGFGD